MQTIPLPIHAYIPGKNERHPARTFDTIIETAVQGHSPEQLARSDAFKAGIKYLEAGFYWEANEVLEPVWMFLPVESEERRFVQGLIQLANGFLKIQMGRQSSVLRSVEKARSLVPVEGTIMAIDVDFVHGWIEVLESRTTYAQ